MATSTPAINPNILARAAVLRQLGVKPGDGLPSWARQLGQEVDPATSPYWAPQEAGSGSSTLGSGTGEGYYGPLAAFAGSQGSGENMEGARGPDIPGLKTMLQSTGQRLMEANNGQLNARWLQDASGKVTATPQIQKVDDSAFWTAAQLAGGVIGGAVGGQAGSAFVNAANTAGNTAVETGNFSQALKQALLSVGTSYASNAASSASGLTGAARNAVSGAVGSGIGTAARGGNLQEVLKSALIGAAPGVAGAAGNNNQALSPVLSTLVRQLASTAVGRKPSTQAGSIQLLMAALTGGGK